MKADVVDAWLKHWLQLQKKGKHPLVLKKASEEGNDKSPTPQTAPSKSTKQKGKQWAHESDDDGKISGDNQTNESDAGQHEKSIQPIRNKMIEERALTPSFHHHPLVQTSTAIPILHSSIPYQMINGIKSYLHFFKLHRYANTAFYIHH